MKGELGLKDSKKITVKSKALSSTYGTLELNWGKYPLISGEYGPLLGPSNKVTLTSVGESQGTRYIASGISHGSCRFIYHGEMNEDEATKVYFSIPELASYFHHELSYKIDENGSLLGDVKIPQLAASFELEGESVTTKLVQGYTLGATPSNNGIQFIHEFLVCFEKQTPFTFPDIEKFLYNTTNLYTWLTGYPVTIDEIILSDGDKRGALYIPTVRQDTKFDHTRPYSFIPTNLLSSNFESIHTHYFNIHKGEFANIWGRTIPLFAFSGMLEYEILLYVSILDRYFSHRVSSLSLGDDLDTFNKKAKAYLNYIGRDCTNIFISRRDIYDAKSIRDRAAHGAAENFPSDRVYHLLSKIKCLVMYLILKDLGFNDDTFLEVMDRTRYPIFRGSGINRYKLDVQLGKATVIRLSNVDIMKFNENFFHGRVFWRKGELWGYDCKLSEMLHGYYFSPNLHEKNEFKSTVDYIKSKVGENYNIRYVEPVYLLNKNNAERIYDAYIIDEK